MIKESFIEIDAPFKAVPSPEPGTTAFVLCMAGGRVIDLPPVKPDADAEHIVVATFDTGG